jgi:hypothetical protein
LNILQKAIVMIILSFGPLANTVLAAPEASPPSKPDLASAASTLPEIIPPTAQIRLTFHLTPVREGDKLGGILEGKVEVMGVKNFSPTLIREKCMLSRANPDSTIWGGDLHKSGYAVRFRLVDHDDVHQVVAEGRGWVRFLSGDFSCTENQPN